MKVGVLHGCARCGQDHELLEFEPLDRPVVDEDGTTWTHWVACPTNGQPVLLRSHAPPAATHSPDVRRTGWSG